jgi:hypothetical protein
MNEQKSAAKMGEQKLNKKMRGGRAKKCEMVEPK